jgi:folate-binding protein YgfZ
MMMDLSGLYISKGALLAPDGIPLHFGDTLGEYNAIHTGGILLDRRHEGRILASGVNVLAWLDNIATNKLVDITPMTGKPTLFTNATARILDRAMVYALDSERVVIITEPNRGDALTAYLRGNIFYQDKITLTDWRPVYHQFALHGTQADALIHTFLGNNNSHSQKTINELGREKGEKSVVDGVYSVLEGSIADSPVYAFRQKPLVGSSWTLLTPTESAGMVWKTLIDAGKPLGIIPSGGLVYNALRIASGRPNVGRELTTEYIPLELGLWDEVSFSKGCYTGQEILARMESRNKLARVLMRLQLTQFAEADTPLFYQGKQVGQITSSVIAPDGVIHAMGVVKTSMAGAGVVVNIGTADGATATLTDYLGVQPRIS